MKMIADIRVYKSETDNIDGNNLPSDFLEKKMNIAVSRLVMKLREANFTLGEFDHLYINFTSCIPDGVCMPAKRSVDQYHPWYRYYDYGIGESVHLDNLEQISTEWVFEKIKHVLLSYFCPTEKIEQTVIHCTEEVLRLGEQMMVLYKEKQSKSNRAEIYLRLLDTDYYQPHLLVKDLSDIIVLEKDLSPIFVIDMPTQYGTILLSNKKVEIKPRNNSIAKTMKLEPILFELKS